MANSRKRFPVKILSLMKAIAVGRPQETSRLGKLGHARFFEFLSTFFGDVLWQFRSLLSSVLYSVEEGRKFFEVLK